MIPPTSVASSQVTYRLHLSWGILLTLTVLTAGEPMTNPCLHDDGTPVDLDCANGGVCQPGPFPHLEQYPVFFDLTPRDEYHCDCDPDDALFGSRCQIPVRQCGYNKADDQEHVCFFGGECAYDGFEETARVCDCRKATDKEENMYIGKYCEQKLVKDSKDCTAANYCANGGICHLNSVTKETSCQCPPEYTGQRCQFKAASVDDCNLDCGPHGVCEIGYRKETSEEADLGIGEVMAPGVLGQHCVCDRGFHGTFCTVAGTASVGDEACDDMPPCKNDGICVPGPFPGLAHYPYHFDLKVTDAAHCDCDPGDDFFGSQCQIPIQHCGQERGDTAFHVCYYGGTCVFDSADGGIGCDCHHAKDENGNRYAGKYCEHQMLDGEGEVAYNSRDVNAQSSYQRVHQGRVTLAIFFLIAFLILCLVIFVMRWRCMVAVVKKTQEMVFGERVSASSYDESKVLRHQDSEETVGMQSDVSTPVEQTNAEIL